jgi:hypothetical protein
MLQSRQDQVFSSTVEHRVNQRDLMRNRRDREVRGQQTRIEILEREIVTKCEHHGIKQGAINLELVDADRVSVIRAKEAENPVTPKRCAMAQLQSRTLKGSPSSFSQKSASPKRRATSECSDSGGGDRSRLQTESTGEAVLEQRTSEEPEEDSQNETAQGEQVEGIAGGSGREIDGEPANDAGIEGGESVEDQNGEGAPLDDILAAESAEVAAAAVGSDVDGDGSPDQ